MLRLSWEIKVYQDDIKKPVIDFSFNGKPEDVPIWLKMMEDFVGTLQIKQQEETKIDGKGDIIYPKETGEEGRIVDISYDLQLQNTTIWVKDKDMIQDK